MRFKIVLAFVFSIYLAVLVINDGFMALDEYWVGVTRYIPAQNSTVMNLVGADDVKSPVQLLPMHIVAQAAYKIGITSPYWQYRSVIFVLGGISFLILVFAFFKFAEFEKLNHQKKSFLFLMLAFYFAAPFSFTRPMFESIAAPWLTLAALWAYRYDVKSKLQDLLWGVVFVSVAFLLRQQLGFCALVFMILPLIKKNYKHFIFAAALGLVLFLLSGIPDLLIRGKYHHSLLSVTLYNFEHGSDYGNRTILFYPILVVIVTFLPFFIKKYNSGFVKNTIQRHRSYYMVLILFVFLHSLFPQKWERFIISMLPILMMMMFPFLNYLQERYHENKLRLWLLYSLNGFLFVIASFFPSQKNLIEMSRYLDHHPEIKTVYRVNSVPEWITDAFILNKYYNFSDISKDEIHKIDWKNCESALVLAENETVVLSDQLKMKASFSVNLIEKASYLMNPKNNIRRVQLNLYSGCEL